MCKISVIIPVYNVEKYIEKCLESVAQQTFEDYEVIIVNDGSKGKEKDIIARYVEKDKRFRYFEKENGGQASARNLGIKMAGGEYIFFLDSDDYIDEECLEKLYRHTDQGKYKMVLCDYYEVDEDKEKYCETNAYICNDVRKNYLLHASSPCCKLISREMLIQNSLYFPEGMIYEDVAIMGAYVLFTDKISYIREALYYYVQRQGSTMNQVVYHRKLEDVFGALENLKTVFAKRQQYEMYAEEFEFIYISHMLHDASLRFFAFEEGIPQLNKIVTIMRETYPKWRHNKYFKMQPWKYKVVTTLFYLKLYALLRIVLK